MGLLADLRLSILSRRADFFEGFSILGESLARVATAGGGSRFAAGGGGLPAARGVFGGGAGRFFAGGEIFFGFEEFFFAGGSFFLAIGMGKQARN